MINGSTLKTLRVSAGLTQSQLADMLGNGGYSSAVIRAIESGRRNIGLNLLADWANACGYDVSIEFRKQGVVDSPDDGAALILPDDFNEPD